MRKIVSFDASLTSFGWAQWVRPVPPSYAEITCGVIDTSKMRGLPRLAHIRAQVTNLVDAADVVIMEGYSYGSRGRAAVDLGELGGVIRMSLFDKGIPYVEVAPAARVKYATGKGTGSKEAVLVAAVRRLDYEGHSTDEADALWILQMALATYELPGNVRMPKVNREALEKPSWP